MLLLVVGVLLAVGVPTAWMLTHRDPALTPVGRGVAVALAEAGPGGAGATASSPGSGTAATIRQPTSATLADVPTAASPSPTAVARPDTSDTAPDATTVTRPSETAAITSRAAQPKSGAQSTKTTPRPSKAAPTTVAPAPVRAPARLVIPAIGVDAQVGPVGVTDRGEMAIPEQVQEIGWYRFGPAPGATAGSAVLSGHVDSAQQGVGAFFRLGELKAGDIITVTDTSGQQLPYRVVGKEAFDKKSVPLAELFSRSGAARLTLITCGGAFDSAARSYLDNVVVTAVPA